MPVQKELISESELSLKLKVFVQDVIDRAVQQYLKETEAAHSQLPARGEQDHLPCIGNTGGSHETNTLNNDLNEGEQSKDESRNTPDINDSSERPLLKERSSPEEMEEEIRFRERCLRVLEYLACCRCTCFKRTYEVASEDD